MIPLYVYIEDWYGGNSKKKEFNNTNRDTKICKTYYRWVEAVEMIWRIAEPITTKTKNATIQGFTEDVCFLT